MVVHATEFVYDSAGAAIAYGTADSYSLLASSHAKLSVDYNTLLYLIGLLVSATPVHYTYTITFLGVLRLLTTLPMQSVRRGLLVTEDPK